MEMRPVKIKSPGNVGPFRPGWALTAVLAVLGLVFLSLGNWQRERAQDKVVSQTAFDTAPLVTRLEGSPPDWARAVLAGRLDGERHLLLDNKLFRGRAGVHVLTPLELENSGELLLVNRGWLPLPPDRSALPEIPTPGEVMEMRGRLAPISQPGVQLGEPATLQPDRWPQLMVYPDWERIETALGRPVHRKVLYLDVDHSAGFDDRNWTPFTMGPDRHRAYAVQWYGLAITALVIWLILGFRAGRSKDT
ncbi:MAG: SURF1 family protein [Xanthomonadales bacterium]|jgi:cytochrome oxidase assembly protein ShyY1|nr:SURF1 family protein [Xanthomonadales bacterium]